MTNLATKFTVFEGQITDNHTELIEVLNSIIDSLGGVPPTPTTTLSDIATLLTSINSNLTNMRAADALFYAANNSLLDQIATNTDTIINNNSLNAQRLIAAILSTACACETTRPLLAPPLDVTPTPLVDDAKCRRIQLYLSLFSTWLFDVASYGSTGAAVTGDVLFALLSSAGVAAGFVVAGGEAGTIFGLPGTIVGAIIGLIVGAIYAFGGTQLVNWANDFGNPTVQADLLAALYAANNADEGQTAFQVTVGDHFDVIPAGIINALWWSAWSNDLYSDTPVVDDSAFDGTICAPAGPPVIVSESCSDRINSVMGGSYDSGDISMVGWTHARLGVAGGGGGIVTFYADGDSKFVLNVASDGADNYWVGTATNVRVIVASSATVYVHLRVCTGTYA